MPPNAANILKYVIWEMKPGSWYLSANLTSNDTLAALACALRWHITAEMVEKIKFLRSASKLILANVANIDTAPTLWLWISEVAYAFNFEYMLCFLTFHPASSTRFIHFFAFAAKFFQMG